MPPQLKQRQKTISDEIEQYIQLLSARTQRPAPIPELGHGRVFGIVINGDAAVRHRANVGIAVDALTSIGVKRQNMFIAGYPPKQVQGLNQFDGTLDGITRMFDSVQHSLRKQDKSARATIVVYITGHGEKDGVSLDSPLKLLRYNTLIEQLKKFKDHKIVLVADCCFSGALPQKIDDAGFDAVAMSAGIEDKQTRCGFFATPFWNAIREGIDPDGNQVSTLEEAFWYAIQTYQRVEKNKAFGTFVRTTPELTDLKQLNDPAILLEVRTSWCKACNDMKPVLGRLNAVTGGVLKIYTIDWEKNPLAKKFQHSLPDIKAFPTFMFFRKGKLVKVMHGTRSASALFEEAKKHFGARDLTVPVLAKSLDDKDLRTYAAWSLREMASKGADITAAIPALGRALLHWDSGEYARKALQSVHKKKRFEKELHYQLSTLYWIGVAVNNGNISDSSMLRFNEALEDDYLRNYAIRAIQAAIYQGVDVSESISGLIKCLTYNDSHDLALKTLDLYTKQYAFIQSSSLHRVALGKYYPEGVRWARSGRNKFTESQLKEIEKHNAIYLAAYKGTIKPALIPVMIDALQDRQLRLHALRALKACAVRNLLSDPQIEKISALLGCIERDMVCQRNARIFKIK